MRWARVSMRSTGRPRRRRGPRPRDSRSRRCPASRRSAPPAGCPAPGRGRRRSPGRRASRARRPRGGRGSEPAHGEPVGRGAPVGLDGAGQRARTRAGRAGHGRRPYRRPADHRSTTRTASAAPDLVHPHAPDALDGRERGQRHVGVLAVVDRPRGAVGAGEQRARGRTCG